MTTNSKNTFSLLRDKRIISILDGDEKYGKLEFINGASVDIAMPYLKGPQLCDISTQFGLPAIYSWDKDAKNKSRREYLDDLMQYCIAKNRCSDLLSYLFSMERFNKAFDGCTANEIKTAYEHIVSTVISKINGILLFGGHELVNTGNNFYVDKIGSKAVVQTPKIKTIDRNYVKDITERALQDIDKHNFDSAITKARTLLEEIFCYVIEQKNKIPSEDGKIEKLYKQVKELYNMHIDTNTDERIKKLLGGLNSIVYAIVEMRNKDSDAHGVGARRISIDEHHARLFVNSAMTMADFILAVAAKANKQS